MKSLAYLPEDYGRIRIVKSLAEVFNEPFGDASVILFPRSLTGDFNALAKKLYSAPSEPGYSRADHAANLAKIAQEQQGSALGDAAALVLSDLQASVKLMLGHDRIFGNMRVENTGRWKGTHTVEQFHIDGTDNAAMGRALCCYTEPVTQWIRSEDAKWVRDTQFKAKKGAEIYSFQPGDIFRIKALPNSMPELKMKKPDLSYFVHRVPQATKEQQDNIRLLWVLG